MRSHLGALALLLCWQVGPLPRLEPKESGGTKWSLSLMGGSGRWENPSFNCAGDLVGAEPVDLRNVGGKLDVERGRLRVSASGSSLHRGAPSGAPGPSLGVFGGLIAYEGNKVGIGGGAMRDWWSESGTGVLGSFYLRIGRAPKAHLLVEVNPISEIPGVMGPFRFGIGFAYGFIGAAMDPYAVDRFREASLLADIAVPVARSVDVRLAGRAGSGYKVGQYGVGGGIRIHSPRR
jgi:hypothetical protein